MQYTVDLLLRLAENIALAIVLAYGLSHVSARLGSRWPRTSQFIDGLIFGLLAVLCIKLPLEIQPGVIVDLRNLMVFLAGPFAGAAASLVAAALAGTYRLYLGGEGAIAGIGAILASAAFGWLVSRWVGRLQTWRSAALAGLGLFSVTMPWFLAVGEFSQGWELLKQVAVPYAIFYIGGTVLLSALLTAEENFRAAQQDLDSSERRFRALAETASDWFWEMDSELRLTYVSSRLLELTGRSRDHFIGKHRRDLAQDTSSDALAQHEATLRKHLHFRDFQYSMQTADGRTCVVSVSGQALFDDLGRFTGYCGSGRDITKETQQRHDLEDARSQAEFASKAKSDFLANMSHELRTPLNAILGFSEVLKLEMMGPHKVPVYKEYAADIHASASLLLEMVNDVLDMAKIESGNLELDIAPCNLGVVVADAVGILKNRARDMGIELRVDVKSALQTAHVDARAIKQVLLNLLSNALKFTEPGGHITVTLEFVQMLGHVIVVKDTGAGIPPDELAKVMEPFYQAKKGAQAAGKGTGLGLALSKALVEAHGGSFHLESTLGRGTAAKVVLPTAVSGTQFEQASAADE